MKRGLQGFPEAEAPVLLLVAKAPWSVVCLTQSRALVAFQSDMTFETNSSVFPMTSRAQKPDQLPYFAPRQRV